jgi:Ca2+-binding EF-hand superfamily protein
MIRMAIFIIASALLLSSCATTSPESQPAQPANQQFVALCRSIDTNQDGRISREELLAAAKNKEEAAALFDMCDVERQGSITYDQAFRNRMLQQVIRLTTP